MVHWLCYCGDDQRDSSIHGRLSNRPAEVDHQGVRDAFREVGPGNEQKVRYEGVQEVASHQKNTLVASAEIKGSAASRPSDQSAEILPVVEDKLSRGPDAPLL